MSFVKPGIGRLTPILPARAVFDETVHVRTGSVDPSPVSDGMSAGVHIDRDVTGDNGPGVFIQQPVGPPATGKAHLHVRSNTGTEAHVDAWNDSAECHLTGATEAFVEVRGEDALVQAGHDGSRACLERRALTTETALLLTDSAGILYRITIVPGTPPTFSIVAV